MLISHLLKDNDSHKAVLGVFLLLNPLHMLSISVIHMRSDVSHSLQSFFHLPTVSLFRYHSLLCLLNQTQGISYISWTYTAIYSYNINRQPGKVNLVKLLWNSEPCYMVEDHPCTQGMGGRIFPFVNTESKFDCKDYHGNQTIICSPWNTNGIMLFLSECCTLICIPSCIMTAFL